ncbi:tellurite resistance TerB family protein [Anabaenopsis tanganyikae CS-531]|uniref:Tellurite resistance TerB family protein n=2 Tax=Anabaenopsis TaxID=110103 RepID=A0ABT5AQT3_9CYAN|nr:MULTISPECIES: tellurite resistance TerB family protein [Anabaenopsis]MDB9538806.1 tellurite resistance TerB family protein [Anabaenopsis arnoldii]MDH6091084.1 tellurite resistance TerB family protein [Anabaenopsis arnoldii]MDH6106959.1 tellurite resistance TerB family protein [Anabaenopsis tanganyikae CS-531]
MTFLNWVKEQQKNLHDSIVRFKNKEFMDAIVAGCALVAAADGHIHSTEKQKMAGFIARSEELRVFEMNDVIERFNYFVSGFEFDSDIGKEQALKAISKFKNNSDAAKLLIIVCCSIGSADNNFEESEKQVVREICQNLSLNPLEFQL